VTLQHCVMKALLTVLDSGPGMAWVRSHPMDEDSDTDVNVDHTALEDIFLSIQVKILFEVQNVILSSFSTIVLNPLCWSKVPSRIEYDVLSPT